MPYLLNPTTFKIHPTLCTLHPTPYTLHPQSVDENVCLVVLMSAGIGFRIQGFRTWGVDEDVERGACERTRQGRPIEG